MNEWATDYQFISPVYRINEPTHLDVCRQVFNENIELSKSQDGFQINEVYPVIMTGNLMDERLNNFLTFLNQSGWNILDSQGYDVSNFETYAREAWGQQHHKFSSMDYHYHPGSILSGFYVISAPENSSQIVFHDPRMHRQFDMSLPLKQINEITLTSTMVYYQPKDGDLFITNSWLPHSFTRNQSEQPFEFIHFNIYCEFKPQCNPPIIV